MNQVSICIPDIAFTDVLDHVWASLFLDTPMTEEVATIAEGALTEWHNKITMMEMAVGAAYLKGANRILKAITTVEDYICDPTYIAQCSQNPELMKELLTVFNNSMLARSKYIKEIWSRVTVNPASVAQGVQKHFHVHVASSLSEVPGFPKELLQNDMIRRRAVMMFDMYNEKFATKTGENSISPPRKRPSRVFQPTEEQRKNSPPPLTKEEMES